MEAAFLARRRLFENLLTSFAVLLLGAFLLLNIIGIYLVGPYAWDDGSITLAYAKTIAENGTFALTKVSEVVEGTSSLLQVSIMALLHGMLGFDFGGFILASQVVAFVFLCMTLILVFNYLQRILPSPFHRLVLVCLFGTLPMFTAEVLNGMEMSLMAFLITSFLISFQNQTKWVLALIPLIILVRFESIFYLLFSLGLFWLFKKDERQRVLLLGACTVALFLLVSIFRWIYFEDFLPNPIWAKMNFPYSFEGSLIGQLYSKSLGVREFLDVVGFMVLLAFASLFLREKNSDRIDLGFFLVISFAVFTAITGVNKGYEGRMYLASLPITVLVIGTSFSYRFFSESNLNINWGNLKVTLAGRSVVFVVMVCCLVGAHLANQGLFISNIKTILKGGHYQRLLPKPLDDVVQRRLQRSKQEFGSWYGVTPENYRITGVAIEKTPSAFI